MSTATAGLVIDRVSVTYRNGHTALRDASFSVPQGSIAALVGVNGSGKSTLFKALMGFVRLATGRDAADAAFATIFGGVQAQAPVIRSLAQHQPEFGILRPQHGRHALSTDDGADRASVWH